MFHYQDQDDTGVFKIDYKESVVTRDSGGQRVDASGDAPIGTPLVQNRNTLMKNHINQG